MKNKKTVVLGVSSGIAAYKSIDLVSSLKKEGVEVTVIMTKSASLMVPPEEFEKAAQNKVHVDLFEKGFDYKSILKIRKVEHIQVADSADMVVISPATAHTIAKIAHGLADDFLTTTILAVSVPIIICPSMNVTMWNNPIVQENIDRLRRRGHIIVEPESGMLACGYEGKGRLAKNEVIKDKIMHTLKVCDELKGKKVLVTAGGTMEKIDDIRAITNRSSGKMGTALAHALTQRGAEVLLLRSKGMNKTDSFAHEEEFSTAKELMDLVKKHVKHVDSMIHTAAVSDFYVKHKKSGKHPSNKPFTISLQPQSKIIDQIKKIHPDIFLVGFKAEYTSDEKKLADAARKKLETSGADAIVVNDVSRSDRGFEADTNEVFIVRKNEKKAYKIPIDTKQKVASSIVEYLFSTANDYVTNKSI